MIEGSFTVTPALKTWLAKEKKSITIDVNSKGCNGNTIFFTVEDKDSDSDVWIKSEVLQLIENGLHLEVDYIDEPLFKRVHINILNRDTCGCGTSFNV